MFQFTRKRCPRCGGSIIREGKELYCLGCGRPEKPPELKPLALLKGKHL